MYEQIQNFGVIFLAWSGAVGLAFFLFRHLGKSWIESKFSERLEHLRVEIDSRLSGVLKIQEKEFETLPEAWNRLDEAYSHVTDLVSPLQRYPDLDRMTPAEVEEFLDKTKLFETQKDDIRQSNTKSDTYTEAIFWHRLHQVKLVCNDLHKYVVRYGIFFPPNLKEKFNKIVSELNSAVLTKEIGKEAKDYKFQNEAWTKIKEEINPLFEAIEREIHARLQSHGSRQ